ncbi:MAG: B12-binding domain-containing radical SAM protein [Methanomassiliicoccales archaeon]|nr:B12-binding domain-containing radical SAM protein [Methanomassiliicoccales archaeon]
MTRIVLTCDETLTSTYRNIPLLDFLGCAPVERVPGFVYRLLDTQLPESGGVLQVAPYSVRKLEAAVNQGGYKDVVVAHPRCVERFIDSGTSVVGISTMDPLGRGPVSMMFTSGGRYTAFTTKKFFEMLQMLDGIRKKRNIPFKIVVGGQGAWQLTLSDDWRKYGIDHLVIGEVDHVAGELLQMIEHGDAEQLIKVKGFPTVEEIPAIIAPSYKGFVEVSRGCGRNCRYCDPNLRRIRCTRTDVLFREIEINVSAGMTIAWLHSDDVFLYKLEDHRNFYPNSEKIVELFRTVMKRPGVTFANPSHGSLAPVAADPGMIRGISEAVGAGPTKWVGIQMGLETASADLLRKQMENKAKPFSPEEWPEVVMKATYVLNCNYWFPAYTVILGLPGETSEDALDTARLIITMERRLKEKLGAKAHFTVTPLAFIPVGSLREGIPFDMKEQMTEERFLLLYVSWKHMAKEIAEFIPRRSSNSDVGLAAFYPFAKVGTWTILRLMRQWGIRMGYDPDRRLDSLDMDLRFPTMTQEGRKASALESET